MIISLTGFMGCGKSSVGRELRLQLGIPLIDLDDYIVEATGRTIPDIFSSMGEKAFRSLEHLALQALFGLPADDMECPAGIRPHFAPAPGADFILSLGGGTLTTPACADLVKTNTSCIYLRATIDTLVENLLIDGTSGRPMLSGADNAAALRAKVEGLMSKREAIYESASCLTLDIDGMSYSEIAHEIISSIHQA